MNKLFDETKVAYKMEHSPYNVKYYVYKDDEKYSSWFTKNDIANKKNNKNTTTCCFSQLFSMLSRFRREHKEWPNRLLFLCDLKKRKTSKYHITYEEICWWISVCKKYKLLPEYVNNEFAKTGNLILCIDTLDINTVYIYLTSARYLQEEPYFVKAIKYFVVDKHMDFYTAFTVASRCCICNTGHHIIPIGKKYPFFEDWNNINFIEDYNLSDINRLKRFLNKKESKNKIPIKNIKYGEMPIRFNLHGQLAKIKVKEIIVKRKKLIPKKLCNGS